MKKPGVIFVDDLAIWTGSDKNLQLLVNLLKAREDEESEKDISG